MTSSFTTYSLMRSKNKSPIFLITIFAPLVIFTKQYESNEDNIFLRKDEHAFRREVQDLRGRFIKNNIEKQKVRLLEQITNNTIFVDGIPHIDIEKSGSRKNEIMAVEDGFRSLLGMDGVEYTYKRDYQWRTWRQIDHNGNKTIVCYKCNSAGNKTCKNCVGYWVIEEAPPPCPFEIMSIPNDTQLCVVNYTEYTNLKNVCPTLFNINDLLITCNNPIETEWKVVSNYNKNSVSTLNVICGGQENCQILTLYTILQDYILFRIVNATDHVIYSRVMKSGNKNYACVKNCGILDRQTKTIVTSETPFIVNLLRSLPTKNKREFNVATVKTSLMNFKSSVNNTKMSDYISKSTGNTRPHSRSIRTTQIDGHNSKTTQKCAKLTSVHIPHLQVSTVKPSNFPATPYGRLVDVFKKKLLRSVASDKKYKNAIGDSIANKVEIVTKTICKRLQDEYQEKEESETIED